MWLLISMFCLLYFILLQLLTYIYYFYKNKTYLINFIYFHITSSEFQNLKVVDIVLRMFL